MNTAKIIKAHCKNTGQYFVIEVEKNGSVFYATKFYSITNDIAKTIKSEISPLALQTGSNMSKCSVCGSRKVGHGHDTTHTCKCGQTKDDKQCIYCGGLIYDDVGQQEIIEKRREEKYDVYFVMDASGSMGSKELYDAANATRVLVKNLEKLNNNYNFIPFGSTYKYLLRNETDVKKIDTAITTYEKDKSNVGYYTNGAVMNFIKNDVINSNLPVRIIVVTDGVWDSPREALTARNEIIQKNKNVEIMAVGIGAANNEFLQKLGTIKEFSMVVDSSKLESTFLDISNMMKTR